MTNKREFPEKFKSLPPFQGRFEANKLKAENCEIYFATYPSGAVIEPHQHKTDNWGVITDGELLLTMNGEESRYGPGEWYHVPANIEHAARFTKDTREVEFWFDPD